MHNPEKNTAVLLSRREVIPGIFHFVLQAPLLAAQCLPGQFVMMQVQHGTDPLLRRPISLCGAGADTIEMLFQVKGRGTQIMASWEPGRMVSVMGPLGKGFVISKTMRKGLLVAGGIGAVPLLYLSRYMSARHSDVETVFFMGTKNYSDAALIGGLLPEACAACFVSEDGSAPFTGLVTDALAEYLHKYKSETQAIEIYSCGPEPMLKTVADIARRYGVPCQVSLEAHMACGVGACLGCVVNTKDGFQRVCADGPVFDSAAIEWNHD